MQLENEAFFENLAPLVALAACEQAALACTEWRGRGQPMEADQAAVDAMRGVLCKAPMTGKVVIGEGERDKAPMLYQGEWLGQGRERGHAPRVDIAVDPLEGTQLCAQDQAGALTVLAMSEAGGLLEAPDLYMEKLAVGCPMPPGSLALDASVADNLQTIARVLKKPVRALTVCVLQRERHENLIEQIKATGARLRLIPDGDVAAILATAQPFGDLDVYMGTGGAPEGVLAAAALRGLGGTMQGRLVMPKAAQRPEQHPGQPPKQPPAGAGGDKPDRGASTPPHLGPYDLMELVPGNHVLFAAAGVTDGALLRGVHPKGTTMVETHAMLVHVLGGRLHSVRFVRALHPNRRLTEASARV